MNEYQRPTTIFDIETRPEPALVEKSLKAFDSSSVKVGNIKDAAKIADKINAAEAAHKAKAYEKAALSPFTGSICAIGIQHPGEDPTLITGDEKDILESFWANFRENESNDWALFTGSNDKALFDPAFIYHRSLFHGVAMPADIVSNEGYFNRCFVDMAKKCLAGLPYPSFKSADSFCEFYGLEGEDVGFQKVISKAELLEVHKVEGKNFHTFIDSEDAVDHVIASVYLSNDLALERAIANRLGL